MDIIKQDIDSWAKQCEYRVLKKILQDNKMVAQEIVRRSEQRKPAILYFDISNVSAQDILDEVS